MSNSSKNLPSTVRKIIFNIIGFCQQENAAKHTIIDLNKITERVAAMCGDKLNEDNRVVVYGDCLEAYCCISGLIELGIAGYEIAFVENFPPEDPTALRVNCFNDETVDERVQQSLDYLGVRVLRKSRLVSWELVNNRVVAIQLMSPMHSARVPCFAMFYFGLKAIDIHAFKAINECGLVYDGGIVVGPMFETNDPHIFAAGTCCNYSRRLYASNRLHKYYNSEDVGESLAKFFLRKLDPFIACHPEFPVSDLLPRYSATLYSRSHSSIPDVAVSRIGFVTPTLSRRWEPILKFKSPIVKSATLPGPLYYMRVRQPGVDTPMEVANILPHQGHSLITDKEENYFKLKLNVLHCVDSVTCLSKKPFSAQILSQLYGKHEAYFNKLLLRYQMQQIDDLYSFFIQPWMAAIYQENFDELMDKINEHEVGAIHDVLQSKYAPLEEDSRSRMGLSACFDTPECEATKRNSTLRSLLNKYARRASTHASAIAAGPTDIPAECGQSAEMRDEVASFWDAIEGERIVFSYIARHIARNCIANPHFAPPKPEYF